LPTITGSVNGMMTFSELGPITAAWDDDFLASLVAA